MKFVKLAQSILDSSIWAEDHVTVRVWITLLAMADWHGMVHASASGIAWRARVTRDEADVALKKFQEPDPDSRSQEHEGKRVERVEGGYLILNFVKYRGERDEEDRRRQNAVNKRKQRTREFEGEGEETPEATPEDPIPEPSALVEAWNTNRGSLPSCNALSDSRRKAAKARLAKTPDLERWVAAIRRIAQSPFCTGQNQRGWVANIDFLLRPDTLTKVEEGFYDARRPVAVPPPSQKIDPEENERRMRAAMEAAP